MSPTSASPVTFGGFGRRDGGSFCCCKQLQTVGTVLDTGCHPKYVQMQQMPASAPCQPWGIAAGCAAAAVSSSPSRPGRSARVTSPLRAASFGDSMVAKVGRRAAGGCRAAARAGGARAAAGQGAQRAGRSDVLRVGQLVGRCGYLAAAGAGRVGSEDSKAPTRQPVPSHSPGSKAQQAGATHVLVETGCSERRCHPCPARGPASAQLQQLAVFKAYTCPRRWDKSA